MAGCYALVQKDNNIVRAREFIIEVKTQRKKFKKSQSSTLANMQVWPELNNNNNPYLAYRYGLALAAAPANRIMPQGPIGGDFTTIGYTDADVEIMKHAAQTMGVKSVNRSSQKSQEPSDTNTVSLVPDRKKIKK